MAKLRGVCLLRIRSEVFCASSYLVFNDDCETLAPQAIHQEIWMSTWQASHCPWPSQLLNQSRGTPLHHQSRDWTPLLQWVPDAHMDLSPWQSHNSNISHEISRKDGSDGSADPAWCSLKITPRNQITQVLKNNLKAITALAPLLRQDCQPQQLIPSKP